MPTTWLVATPSEIVHSLPQAAATTHTGQHYAFEVRGKKFCYYLVDHHGDGRVALNLKAAPGVQQALVGDGTRAVRRGGLPWPRGWLGLDLGAAPVDWTAVAALLTDACRLTAPKKLVAQL